MSITEITKRKWIIYQETLERTVKVDYDFNGPCVHIIQGNKSIPITLGCLDDLVHALGEARKDIQEHLKNETGLLPLEERKPKGCGKVGLV